MIDLRSDRCDLCGAGCRSVVAKEGTTEVVKCVCCGLFWADHDEEGPSGEAVDSHAADLASDDVAISARDGADVYPAGLDLIERHAFGKGRLLDVGCGDGTFLAAARDRGWDAHGINVWDATGRPPAGQLDAEKVQRFELDNAGFEAGSFNAVTMWNSIEHVQSPKDTIDAIHRLLAPNGVLFLRAPNVTLSSLLRPARPVLSLAGKEIPYLLTASDQRLHGFTPRTLQKLVSLGSFEVLDVGAAPVRLSRYEARGRRIGAIARAGSGALQLAERVTGGSRSVFPTTQLIARRRAPCRRAQP